MTNAEQIALYWKQVEAIEEERVSLDDKADAIRAKIRALEPPMSESDRAIFQRAAAQMVESQNQMATENGLWAKLIANGEAKIGQPLRVRLPTDYTVRNTHG
jgi:hypothetical protein